MLDEVHRYRNWSLELKNINDTIPDLKVVFTSSSALEVYKGSHDLSRRALIYNLPGLSFREYLNFKLKIKFPTIDLEQTTHNSTDFSIQINEKIKPLEHFNNYLQNGYYPFFVDAGTDYLKQLMNTVNLTVEVDLRAICNIDFNSVLKIKKMLSDLSNIIPYKPNIESLANQIGTTRDSLLKYLYYIEKAQIVKWLVRDKFGINYLNKPDKLYLNNPNLAYSLCGQKPDTGNLRGTFFLNQTA